MNSLMRFAEVPTAFGGVFADGNSEKNTLSEITNLSRGIPSSFNATPSWRCAMPAP